MKIEVINSRVYGNPYQKLLYRAISSRYQISLGTINRAIEQQKSIRSSLYHIHWEESFFSRCTTVAQANRLRCDYVERLKRYVAMGGKVVWTLHNVKPHEGRFVQAFLCLRRDLAVLSHRILVHNQAALSVLREQTGLADLSKVSILPHPAYFDVYESTDRTKILAGQPPANPRTLLHFGLVRAYKGIPGLVRKLSSEFMAQHQLALHICGEPLRADSFLDELLAQTKSRPEIRYSLEPVHVDDVANLLRSHVGLIVPYHHVLTSGVAALSLTLGVPTIAPNTPAMKELYPDSSHFLLFNPRSPRDLRRAVLALVDMSAETRNRIAQDYVTRALSFHPDVVSQALGAIYDELLGLVWGSDGYIETASSAAPLKKASVSRRCQRVRWLDGSAMHAYIPFLNRQGSNNGAQAISRSKSVGSDVSNQELALKLVQAALFSNSRFGTSEELTPNQRKNTNCASLERTALDTAYAVRLYEDLLFRLNQDADRRKRENLE